VIDKLKYTYSSLSITILHQENQGLSASRNAGFSRCSPDTEYVMFLDEDDYAKPYELETFVRVAKRINADALTNWIHLFDHEIPTNEKDFDTRFVGVGPCIPAGFFINIFGASNIFLKKEAFESIGKYKEYAFGYEDWDLSTRLALHKYNYELVPASLYWYRNTPNSMMKDLFRDDFEPTKVLLSNYQEVVPKELYLLLQMTKHLIKEEWSWGGKPLDIP
jgi:glycosyltransferase involved in cell wall biosynthesis